MDSKITVRFFRITKNHQAAPDFEAALQNALAAGQTAAARQRNINGSIIRLERLAANGTCWDGEIVRKQTQNIPPAADDDGLTPLVLNDGSGLGHSIAFRYSPGVQVLAIQFDNRAVSVNRLVAYLRAIDPAHDYGAFPLIRRDAWERYGRGSPSSVVLEIAAPADLPAVEGEVGSVIASTKRLAEMANAPVITIEVKMGRTRGSLSKGFVDGILDFFTRGEGREQDVRKLGVTSRTEDAAEYIDFLQEGLKHSDTLDLPSDDPNVNYRARRNYLEACFNESFDYIRGIYGGG